jgi:hypothetical protein
MSVVLCIIIVLSFGGCSGKKTTSTNNTSGGNKTVSSDAYDLYMAAVKKLKDASSNSLNMSMTFEGSDGENSGGMTTRVSAETVYNEDKTDVKYKMTTKTDMRDIIEDLEELEELEEFDGFEIERATYYTDGFMYMVSNGGGGFKMAKSIEEALSEQGQDAGAEKITSFRKANVIESNVKKVSNGTQVTFTIDPDFAKALTDNIPESEKKDDSEFIYDSLTVTAIIDNVGSLISSVTETKYTSTSDKGTHSTKITFAITDIVTGGVEIDFPKDLDKYPDLESRTE